MHDYAKIRAAKEKDRAAFAELCKRKPARRPATKGTKRGRRKLPSEHFHVRNKSDYQRYLTTRHWRQTRRRVLKARGGRCAMCGIVSERPQVHHRHYKTLWREQNGDLQVLCRGHHETHHLGVTGDELAHLRACAAGA